MTKTKKTAKPKAKPIARPKAKPKKIAAKKPKTSPKQQIKKHNPVKPKETVKSLPNEYFCSFCNRSNMELMALISGPKNNFICHNCIEICNAILLEEFRDVWQQRMIDLYSNPGNFRRPFIE